MSSRGAIDKKAADISHRSFLFIKEEIELWKIRG
jgi:hypothetical protein